MSPALKYTDRDVRENSELEQLALDYLHEYDGEFSFLIDCRMRIHAGLPLSIGMIRGILNCMRVDPRLTVELPEPLPVEEAEVVNINTKRRKRQPRGLEPCPFMEKGLYHDHKRHVPGQEYCPGFHRINRSVFQLDATVHEGLYAVGRSWNTVTVHKPVSAVVSWYPPVHEEGPAIPQMHVKLACKNPSWLKMPILFKPEQWDEVGSTKNADYELFKCKRCFPDMKD